MYCFFLSKLHRKGNSNHHNDGVSPFSDVQPCLPIRVDVVFCNEALSREAQEHTRCPALTHFVSQHHYLKEVRGEGEGDQVAL